MATGVIGGVIKGIINAVGGVFKESDELFTSKEEKKKLEKEITEVILSHEEALEAEVTKRWQADMVSDNKLSKNIRPLSLIFTTAVVTIMAFTHGNIGEFVIDEAYIATFKAIMLAQYLAYFGSRGYVQAMKLKNGKK